MAQAELKTKPTEALVEHFIAALPDPQVRADCQTLCKLMHDITKAEPKMWGPSIIGFGEYHYKYASGREGDMPLLGFSPRKQALTVYSSCYPTPKNEAMLAKLGKHTSGKSCIYFKRVSDIDLTVLEKILRNSIKELPSLYGK